MPRIQFPHDQGTYDTDRLRELLAAEEHVRKVAEDQVDHPDEWEACTFDPAGSLERMHLNCAEPESDGGQRALNGARAIAYRVLGFTEVYGHLPRSN